MLMGFHRPVRVISRPLCALACAASTTALPHMKTAKALGLTLSSALLSIADEVIE